MKPIIFKSIEKQKHYLPKGFLSSYDVPTIYAVLMFFVYLSYLPKKWNKNMVNTDAVQMVRSVFGVDYGFETMIRWGIQHGCCKSKTSSGRHSSMSKAYVLAQGLIGAGVKMSDIGIKDLLRAA